MSSSWKTNQHDRHSLYIKIPHSSKWPSSKWPSLKALWAMVKCSHRSRCRTCRCLHAKLCVPMGISRQSLGAFNTMDLWTCPNPMQHQWKILEKKSFLKQVSLHLNFIPLPQDLFFMLSSNPNKHRRFTLHPVHKICITVLHIQENNHPPCPQCTTRCPLCWQLAHFKSTKRHNF